MNDENDTTEHPRDNIHNLPARRDRPTPPERTMRIYAESPKELDPAIFQGQSTTPGGNGHDALPSFDGIDIVVPQYIRQCWESAEDIRNIEDGACQYLNKQEIQPSALRKSRLRISSRGELYAPIQCHGQGVQGLIIGNPNGQTRTILGQEVSQGDTIFSYVGEINGGEKGAICHTLGALLERFKKGEADCGAIYIRHYDAAGTKQSVESAWDRTLWTFVEDSGEERNQEPYALTPDMLFTRAQLRGYKPQTWLIEGMIPAGKTGGLTASGGTGKSILSSQLAISVATGAPFLDEFSVASPGKVLVFSAEEDREELDRRILNAYEIIRDSYDYDFPRDLFEQRIGANLFTHSLVGVDGIALTARTRDGMVRTPAYHSLLKMIEQIPDLKLIIFDVFGKFMGGNENETEDVMAFIQAMDGIAQTSGAFVMTTFHANKYSMRQGGDSMNQSALRGASAITDGLRFQMNIATMNRDLARKYGITDERERMSLVQMGIPKNNYAPPFGEIWLRRGKGGFMEYTELMSQKDEDEARVLERCKEIIKRDATHTEYTKNSFATKFAGLGDGKVGVGQKATMRIIDDAIERKEILSKPPRVPRKNTPTVLYVP